MFCANAHFLKEAVSERERKLAILHQQEVPQSLKVLLHSQLHKEVIHHRLIHQAQTEREGERGGEKERGKIAQYRRVTTKTHLFWHLKPLRRRSRHKQKQSKGQLYWSKATGLGKVSLCYKPFFVTYILHKVSALSFRGKWNKTTLI